MDPFLTLLHGFSQSLSDEELSSLKFLSSDKIGKRKLEAVQSGWELFTILIEQQDIAKDDLSFLEGLLENIKRQDLVSQLKRFVEEEEINAPENQPDAHERPIAVICDNIGRHWKTLMRQLELSDVQLDRVENAHPRDLREQQLQALRAW
ncbi:FADD protein, partial [Alcedo cyanopectus]|nr:FADD protein [Ceyx cyanopectus]